MTETAKRGPFGSSGGLDGGTTEELYQHAPCGYVSTAADGTIVRLNQTLLRWLGRAEAEVVGRIRFQDLIPSGPRVLWLSQHVPQLDSRGQLSGVALDLVRADGSRLPVLVGGLLVRPMNGGTPLMRLTIFDATERRDYEAGLIRARQAAEESERRARVLQRVTQACASAITPAELLEPVVTAAATAWDALGSGLWLGEAGGRLERGAGSAGLDPALAPAVIEPSSPCPIAAAARTGGVVATDPSPELREKCPELYGAMVHAGAQTLAAVPVRYADEHLGVLAVYLPYGRSVTDEDCDALSTIGAMIGQALARTRLHEEMHRLALHDSLTGLPNRVLLMDRLERAVAGSERTGRPFAVLLVDLDGFKDVNDTLGHAVGDRTLVAVAERMAASVRQSDTVARLGGDEFAVVCEDADAVVADVLARRILEVLADPLDVDGARVAVTGSVGVTLGGPGRSTGELLSEADKAMYVAKRSGKSRHAFHGRDVDLP